MIRRTSSFPAATANTDEGRPTALVFIDMPACGGAVLDAGLPLNRQRRGGRRGPEELFEGVGGISPRDVDNLRRAARKVNPKGLLLLRGPFPFAIDALLAEQLTDKRELRYITFLREPVDRAISHYLYALDQPLRGLRPLPCDTSFDEAVGTGYIQDNLQTRMLSGSLEPSGEVNDAMLEDAKRNLRERFVYFGLAERLAESLVLARLRLELGTTIYRGEPALDDPTALGHDVSEETRTAATRANWYDAELYRYARELFSGAHERKRLEFQCEVAAVDASRTNGEIEVTAPRAPAFEGGEREWQMLVGARAEGLRLEWELAGDGALATVGVGESGKAPHG